MDSPTDLLLISGQAAIVLLGFVTNGFIPVVNLLDWKCSNVLSTSDYYIAGVALSNLSLQLWSGLNWCCDLVGNYGTFCQNTFSMMMISTLWSFKMGGLLCMFYCTKIVLSKNSLLRFFQRRLHTSFKKVICKTIMSSFILGIPLFLIKKQQLTPKSVYVLLSIDSISFNNNTFEDNYFVIYRIFFLTVGYTTPLLLSLVSAACIIVSLEKHIKTMQDTMEKNHGVFIDAHRRAGKTVLSLLILFIMYFVTSVITIISIFPEGDLRFLLCDLVSMLYAPALGIVLIKGNSKLRKAATRIKMKLTKMLRLHKSLKENISVQIIPG